MTTRPHVFGFIRQVALALGILAAFAGPVVASAQAPARLAATGRGSAIEIATHDNRDRAGTLDGGILRVRLEVVRGVWRPEGRQGPERDVFAFAEEARGASIPGPLLRVREGTELHVTVRNRVAVPVRLHGLVTRPAASDDFTEIAPDSVREFRFRAGAPGTYFYWGRTSDSAFTVRDGEDSQLTGAFVVDAAGAEPSRDRVFVLGEWRAPVPPIGTPRKVSFVINGRSWPHTERLILPFGLAEEWRVINGTVAVHPMHLHGTFYTVESRGNSLRDARFEPGDQRLVTTELMEPGSTMAMRWVPDRVGNWLFHCHILAHVTGRMRDADAPADPESHTEHDPEQAMAGLVLGITVQAGDETAAPDLQPHVRRRLALEVRQIPNRYGTAPGYGFALASAGSPATAPAPNAPLSPTIVLARGEPVVIGVVNAIDDALAIHWHGIELESFNDGVPGWSGQSGQIMPPVQPQQRFDVNFTPPRSGTFIYHTHGHDSRQLVSGMYGALVVLEPGETFDPSTDHVVLLGGAGPGVAAVEMNRSTNPPLRSVRAGVRHRFRFINITPNNTITVSLRGESGLAQWRGVAKDGAELPPAQATMGAASFRIGVGETYDFEFEPTAPGDWRLEALRGGSVTTMLVRVVR